MSASSSSTDLRAVHDAMAAQIANGNVPGLVWAVHRRGETHVEAIGAARRDTIFRVSSMSKPIVAAAAMTLVDDGTFALDDPVERWLPELANRRVMKSLEGPLDDTVPAKRAITVRDLLTFRMGFGLVWGKQDALPIQRAAHALHLGVFGPPHPQEPPPADEWMRRFATLPLMHQPGERWMYNTGAEILGVLLARAATEPLDALLRRRLLDPLGMRDTGFFVPPASIARLPESLWVDPATGKLSVYDAAAGGEWSKPPAFPSGAAGLVSTIDDLIAFGRMMIGGGALGSTRVLSARSVEAMTRDQIPAEQKAASSGALDPDFWKTHGWGLGMATTSDGGFGWDGGLGTSWWSKGDGFALLLTQRGQYPAFNPTYRAFWDAVNAAA